MRRDPTPATGPELTEYRLSTHNVLGTFPTMDEARTAIEALGQAGIEGQRVHLSGKAAGQAAEEPEKPTENAAADAAVLSRWAGIVIVWGVFGAIVGAFAGIAVGSLSWRSRGAT